MCIVNNIISKLCSCRQVKSMQQYRSQMFAIQAAKRQASNQLPEEGPSAKMAKTNLEAPSRSTRRFKCIPCDIGYFVEDHLKTHIRRQHGGNFNVGSIIPQKSQDSGILINFNNSSSSSSNTSKIGVQPPTNPINGLVKNLNKRINSPIKKQPRFHCKRFPCKRSFGNELNYKQHVLIVHNKVGQRNFPKEEESKTTVNNTPKPKAAKRVYVQKHQSSLKIPARRKTTTTSRRRGAKPAQPWKDNPTIPNPKQMTPSVVCRSLGLNDYPVPVNKYSLEYFKERSNFDEYINPLLQTVNPKARQFEILTLGQAKWYELLLTKLDDLESKNQ